MNKTSLLLLFCFVINYITAQSVFDNFFEKKSLRIDFTLSGDSVSQSAALFQLREEPVWAGPIVNLIDTFQYGGYYVHLYDKESQELIYSRGFNTLFEEWRATEQASSEAQSWINSISVPYPKQDVVFELFARERTDMQFHSLMKVTIDPQSIYIDRSELPQYPLTVIRQQGEYNEKVDFVFLAEGYTVDEEEKFLKDVRRFTEHLFKTPPFDMYQDQFNMWAVSLPSEDSGTDIAGEGIFKNTALNSGFYTFGVDRYLTTRDMKAIRDAVWNIPCDAIFVLVNTERYGGGGMYNFYAIGSADNPRTVDIFVHELGHSFAGLADEYFSSEVAYDDFYNLAYEPWEPNITSLKDFGKKWGDLLPPGTPVPTPVTDQYTGFTGVYEGAGYVSKGMYRPMDHCMMRDYAPFCPVCSRAIIRMIRFLTDK